MSKWLISVPCWGDRVQFFCWAPLNSIVNALGGRDATILVHTDQPVANRGWIEFVPLPSVDSLATGFEGVTIGPPYSILSACHRDALRRAAPGQFVMLLCADIMISAGAFDVCEHMLTECDLVMACILRTLPPTPADFSMSDFSPRALRRRLADCMHPYERETICGEGHIANPFTVIFRNPDGFVARSFCPHPLALRKTETAASFEQTIDCGLASTFPQSRIRVATDLTRLCGNEISDPEARARLTSTKVSPERIAEFAGLMTSNQRWCFTQRFVLSGSGDMGDEELQVCDMVGCN